MTGIPRNTLIAWERRYGLLKPQRLDNGYRRYTESDVAQLLKLKNALNAGLRISDAVKLVRGNVSSEAKAPEAPMTELTSPSSMETSTPFSQIRDQLFTALSSYQAAEAQSLLGTLLTIPFHTRLHQIYFPLLRNLGDAWSQGSISVAQEHFATGIIKAHLATIFLSTGQASASAPHAATTTLPHDEHEIAALAMAIQLSLSGHRVSYLGSQLPVDDLIGFCESQKPKLVCVSCITLPAEEQFQEYLSKLPALTERGVRITLGGYPLAGRKSESAVEMIPSWDEFKF